MFTPTTGKWAPSNPFLHTNRRTWRRLRSRNCRRNCEPKACRAWKIVRNAREFNTLGQAATGGLDASASPGDFAQAVGDFLQESSSSILKRRTSWLWATS